MAYVRLPAIVAIPLCVIGGLVWAGKGIAGVVDTATAKPKISVYADPDAEVTVEVLDAKQKVERTFILSPGERSSVETTRGQHTVRSTRKDGTKHEVSVKLGIGDQYAVPTSSGQCFAVLNIGSWYAHRDADVIDAKIEQRLKTSAPFEFPDETYASLYEAPETIDYKDHPKLVTAFPCAKMAGASDGEILATLERGLVNKSETLTAVFHQNDAPIAKKPQTRAEMFSQRMADEKKDWTRVYEGPKGFAYRHKNGAFVMLTPYEIPSAQVELQNPGALAKFVANIDQPGNDAVLHETDLFPYLVDPTWAPKAYEPGVKVSDDVRAKFIMRRASWRVDESVEREMLEPIGGDMEKLALANMKTRYAAAAEKCVAKLTTKPIHCTSSDNSEASAIVILMKDSPKVKGKVWFRFDTKGLQVMKATPKIPTTGFGQIEANMTEKDAAGTPWFFTLDKGELTNGLK